MSPSTIARRSSAGDEPETIASATFGPTPGTESSCSKSSRSAGLGEPVELEHVLPHVHVRVERDLRPSSALRRARSRAGAGSHAADVEHESVSIRETGLPVSRAITPRPPSQRRASAGNPDRERVGGVARLGGESRRRIACTICCTCAFSARP